MFRLALTTALLTAALLPGDSAARADGFDSLINLELAFRDTILEMPAPDHYQSLIRDGETTITFVRDWPDGVGKTDFFLNLDWSFDYRYKTQTTAGVTEVSVTPLNIKLMPRLRHVIRMPVAWHHAKVWESRLLAHEFDHVAVSLDPRARALLVHLCGELPKDRFSISGREKPSTEQLQAGTNRAIQRRQSAILELIRANYVALDKVSGNGRKAMQDRKDFFESLYTQANLEATEFPFQKEVASLLESEAYRPLRPHYVPTEPMTLPVR